LTPANYRSLAYGLAAVLSAINAVLTLLPLALPSSISGSIDKVYHFIAFVGLILPVAALWPRGLVWMIPAALLFGTSIEIIQPFINRSRELADFLANGVGILVGSAFGFVLHRLRRRRVR
jgi:VanZ family protein